MIGIRPLFGLLALDARADRGEADPFFGEIPMVLTASRLAQSPLGAPAPVTVVDLPRPPAPTPVAWWKTKPTRP